MTKFLSSPWPAVLAVLVLLCVGILLLGAVFGSTMDGVEWQEEIYRVKSGDSLWKVSGLYCPDDVDRREWIAEVQELNDLEDSIIYPGQRLKVLAPVEEG